MQHERVVLAAYLSGHGYGHFTRSAAVLERLVRDFPRVEVHLRTSAQALRLARRVGGFASVTEIDVGPGVAQRGPLEVDLPATLLALQQYLERLPRLIESEAAWLQRVDARLVFADVPPLGFAAAARARVASVGMGNFTWSWIYEGYAEHDARFGEAARRLFAAESQATEFLALAGGGGLEHFAQPIAIAPVARRPRLDRDQVRRRLGIAADDQRKVALLSFGGFGAELNLANAAMHNEGLLLLLVSGPPGLRLPHAISVEPGEPQNPDAPPPSDASQGGVGDDAPSHPDLVAAADCVIGKPGYGTVAECLHRPTAFAHVPRGEFREYPELVRFIERFLPSAPLPFDDFRAGRFRVAVERAIESRPSETPPAGDGVAEAAAHLALRLGLAPR